MFRGVLTSLLACAAIGFWASENARADGLIVISNPPTVIRGHFSFAPLEVTYHKVDVTIKDQMALTSVDQEFYNPNPQVLEGDYIFPVPLNANINKFTMDINGKQVEAELLPADKARGIYNEIVRKARDPALLEYAGRDMFRVHIFPIEANGRKHITLKYSQLVKQDNGLLDYHYTLNTEKFSSKPLQNVSIRVNIETTDPITTLYSPTHEVDKVMHGDRSATVGFEAKNVRPDSDFHLFIGRKATPAGGVGISLLSYRPDPAKEGYFVLLASPTVSKDAKVLPKDVVFVMDTSGSMAGDKIEQARKALRYCIDTLNPQDNFDVIRFSTEAEPLFGSTQPANPENRKKATDFAAGLKAAGGTAIDDALLKAIDESKAHLAGSRMPLVVFMTDGQPTIGEQNPDAILKHEQQAAAGAQIRIFTFGVGTDVNTRLLDLMAEQTRGYSQYVLPSENLELSMSSFWGKVQDPIIASLKVDSGSLALTKVYPREMPDLFKGDQLVVFGTYEKAGKTAVTITGTVNGQQQKFPQDVTFDDKTDDSREWIAKLWATRRVGYLLDEIRLHGESKELKDEVVDLARKWGVVTPYTAMLIIEDERARGIPIGQRSLREMEFDNRAVNNAAAVNFSMNGGIVSGNSVAVANSVNTNAYKSAQSLDRASELAQQSQAHLQVDALGPALTKGPDAPSAQPASSTVGGFAITGAGGMGGGGGGGVGGRGGSYAGQTNVNGGTLNLGVATTSPAVSRERLNFGTASQNGWQTADKELKDQLGYRVINNYAQQTRTINNRNFFLNGNQWTDGNVQNLKKETPHVKVIFNSDAYFDLLAKHPQAAQYLSLGNNITLELGGTIYDIVEETKP